MSTITISATSTGFPVHLNFLMHVISLMGTWYLYFLIKKNIASYPLRVLLWAGVVVIYFYALIMPIIIFIGHLIGYLPALSFKETYAVFHQTLLVEVVASILVTSLYLIQFEIKRALEQHKLSLENIVNQRTKELALTNKKLTHLNENLDDMVQDRAIKIEKQLLLLVKYANMNAHEVRAPLARLLGLTYIINKEDNEIEKNNLLIKINESANELDNVVKKMNRLLEKEIFAPKEIGARNKSS